MQLSKTDLRALERLITVHRKQKKVADLLGVSEATIGRYRNGDGPCKARIPKLKAAIKSALGEVKP